MAVTELVRATTQTRTVRLAHLPGGVGRALCGAKIRHVPSTAERCRVCMDLSVHARGHNAR